MQIDIWRISFPYLPLVLLPPATWTGWISACRRSWSSAASSQSGKSSSGWTRSRAQQPGLLQRWSVCNLPETGEKAAWKLSRGVTFLEMLSLRCWLPWSVWLQCLQAELPAELTQSLLSLLVVPVQCDTDLLEFHTPGLGIWEGSRHTRSLCRWCKSNNP